MLIDCVVATIHVKLCGYLKVSCVFCRKLVCQTLNCESQCLVAVKNCVVFDNTDNLNLVAVKYHSLGCRGAAVWTGDIEDRAV